MAEKQLAQIWYEEITSLSPYVYLCIASKWLNPTSSIQCWMVAYGH